MLLGMYRARYESRFFAMKYPRGEVYRRVSTVLKRGRGHPPPHVPALLWHPGAVPKYGLGETAVIPSEHRVTGCSPLTLFPVVNYYHTRLAPAVHLVVNHSLRQLCHEVLLNVSKAIREVGHSRLGDLRRREVAARSHPATSRGRRYRRIRRSRRSGPTHDRV